MRENLRDFDCTQEEGEADIIVVNSCTVTNGADSGVRSYVRRANELGKQVVFTGCGVKTQGKALYTSGLVAGVLGHSHKEHINAALHHLRPNPQHLDSSIPKAKPQNTPESSQTPHTPNPQSALESNALQASRFFYDDDLERAHIDSTIVSEFVGKSRAFIKIQEGCDFACSYCIIPSVRGRSRSLPLAHIIDQVKVLLDSGISEVVLTGTNVGSYGKSLLESSSTSPSLAMLLEELFALEGLRRVRIGSLEPSQITQELFALLSHPKLERHLHIALQHTHDDMLEKMNRHNRFASDYDLLHKIAELGYAIGTDFIVGHPGESDEIWREAFANLTTLPLTHIHPFIYSVRDGTASASMRPVVNGAVSKQRLHELTTHIATANHHFRTQKLASGAALNVLIEKQLGNVFVGLDEFYNKIFIESTTTLPQWIAITDYEVQKEHNHAKI